MSVSIKEIARMCGVSEGTVDRALNNRSGIKEETKKRILETAEKMNYHPNHLAKSLATGCTKTIGVVCFNIIDSFFSSLIEVIENTAKEQGYFIMLILTKNNKEKELEAIKYLTERKVDGLILFPAVKGSSYVNMLKRLDIPVVTIYNRISDDFVHIDTDCASIMREAVSFIHSKGYDTIAYLDIDFPKAVAENKNIYSFQERRKGYVSGIEECGLKEIIFDGFDKDSILEYISVTSGKKALLCAYDTFAVRVLGICRQNGYKVPYDVGLMGYNNMDVLRDIYPRLYSVDCNIREIGRIAFESLLAQIKGRTDVSDSMIECSISYGESL